MQAIRTMASSSSQSHDSLVKFGEQHVTAGLGRIVNAVLTKGEGSYVTLGDGRKLLDFACGIGVTSLGEWIVLIVYFPNTPSLTALF